MLKNYRQFSRIVVCTLLLLGVSISSSRADDDGEERGLPLVVNAKWKEECSGCHIAYPPRFLPERSWRTLMSGLDKHFGSDASLDAATVQEITMFLEKNADQRHRSMGGKPILRISEMRWFKSEHDEVSSRTWRNPKVKSPSNCGACHTQADLGDFSERNVRIPR
ncbi:MAG: cytochrome C [Gallionella sp.]|nr:cytochrome C [Gallionella sp.]